MVLPQLVFIGVFGRGVGSRFVLCNRCGRCLRHGRVQVLSSQQVDYNFISRDMLSYWCTAVTERFASCETATVMKIGTDGKVTADGFFIEMGSVQVFT